MLSATRKAWLWGSLSIVLGEGVPIGCLYVLARLHQQSFLGYLKLFIGYSGPIVTAYGILAAAFIDIILDENSFSNLKRHTLDITLYLFILLLVLHVQVTSTGPLSSATMLISGVVSIFAFVIAALAKRDSWRRLTHSNSGN